MADSAIWVKVFPTTPPADTGVGEWAEVTGGTVTEYTKADGSVMEVHTLTANGNLTVVTPGYAEVLVVGGGGRGYSGSFRGGGGGVRSGLFTLPAGTHACTIGIDGGTNGLAYGTGTTFGTLFAAGGGGYAGGSGSKGWGGSGAGGDSGEATGYGAGGLNGGAAGTVDPAGVFSAITGTNLEYGRGGTSTAGTNNYGQGGGDGFTTPRSGVVIVAVKKSPATASGVVASGGTETTYVGDGTNGVLGQSYKQHSFTTVGAAGNFVVTTGGEAEVLVMSGGAGGSGGGASTPASAGAGGNGRVVTMDIPVGTFPVRVGAGGAAGPYGADTGGKGGASYLGDLRASDGSFGPAWNCVASGTNWPDNIMYQGSRSLGGSSAGAGGSITGTGAGTPGVGVMFGGLEYGAGALGSQSSATATPVRGGGGQGLNSVGGGQAGATGAVVIRYKV
jgi:hypothetical protein